MRSLLALCLILALPLGATATTIHVPADQPSISLGLASATQGDTVLVACGEYHDVYLTMTSGVTLKAEGNSCATLFAVSTNRLFQGRDLAPGTRIEGFIITGGDAPDGSGGAMSFHDSSIEIRACWFLNNSAFGWGGAIQLYNCDALIESSFIQANHAYIYGGGIGAHGGTLTLRNSGLDWNAAAAGGGLCVDDGVALVEDCTFTHNHVGAGPGGAIYLLGNSTLQMSRSTVGANEAARGAGIFVDDGSSAVLAECIVAVNYGSGLQNEVGGESPGELVLSCSDVFGNPPANYGGSLQDQTGIDGNISADPLICDIDAPDLPDIGLAANSPCLPQNNACGVLMGVAGQGCEVVTALPDAPPAVAALLPNRPNPFNPSTEIVFSLAASVTVTLTIHDATGRHLATLLDAAPRPEGEQSVRWDGRDATGHALPSGIYLARLESPGGMVSRKLTLLK